MSGRPPFGKMILLIASGAALAFFSCLGAISAGRGGGLVVGGTGFVVGLVLLLVSLLRLVYYVFVWIIDRIAGPPSAASTGAPNAPAVDDSSPSDVEPPQSPQG
jgi:hypothetical protein